MIAFLKKLLLVAQTETQGLHAESFFLLTERSLARPDADSSEHLRRAGFAVAPGVTVEGLPRITGKRPLASALTLETGVSVGYGAVLDLEEKITIGQGAVLGPFVTILTSTHELGPREHRAGAVTRAPVHIGPGALLGARVLVLPGVTIGANAEVRPGSVVNRDVAPGAVVEGVPAVHIQANRP
jgi:maltose O-acetyltransferase